MSFSEIVLSFDECVIQQLASQDEASNVRIVPRIRDASTDLVLSSGSATSLSFSPITGQCVEDTSRSMPTPKLLDQVKNPVGSTLVRVEVSFNSSHDNHTFGRTTSNAFG